MENFDPHAEQQVWQRVFAQPAEVVGDDLRELLRIAMELAAAYRSLTGALTGKAREQAKQLYEGEAANIACLKGMRILSGRQEEMPKVHNPSKESPRRVLERCYHRSRRSLTEYTARSVDAEFGVVFQKMAEREGAHCVLLAQLLGSMQT